jgi:hypothetical protein
LYKILITISTECPIVPYTYIYSALLTIKRMVCIELVASKPLRTNTFTGKFIWELNLVLLDTGPESKIGLASSDLGKFLMRI